MGVCPGGGGGYGAFGYCDGESYPDGSYDHTVMIMGGWQASRVCPPDPGNPAIPLAWVPGDDTSCAFADNVRWAWYSQPGTIVTAFSPITNQTYTMQCTSTATTFWPVAKRCVGVNSYGVGLIVFID